jgi:hypothetical protein
MVPIKVRKRNLLGVIEEHVGEFMSSSMSNDVDTPIRLTTDRI